jgi:hypothetical protein
MLTRFSILLCVLFAIVLAGCAKTEPTNSNASTGNANKPATAPTTAPVVARSGEKIGIPECDEFITAYEACVTSKVPELQRATYKTAVDQWRSSWKKLAENPQTKPTLVAACKQAAAQAATSMKSYGCTF